MHYPTYSERMIRSSRGASVPKSVCFKFMKDGFFVACSNVDKDAAIHRYDNLSRYRVENGVLSTWSYRTSQNLSVRLIFQDKDTLIMEDKQNSTSLKLHRRKNKQPNEDEIRLGYDFRCCKFSDVKKFYGIWEIENISSWNQVFPFTKDTHGLPSKIGIVLDTQDMLVLVYVEKRSGKRFRKGGPIGGFHVHGNTLLLEETYNVDPYGTKPDTEEKPSQGEPTPPPQPPPPSPLARLHATLEGDVLALQVIESSVKAHVGKKLLLKRQKEPINGIAPMFWLDFSCCDAEGIENLTGRWDYSGKENPIGFLSSDKKLLSLYFENNSDTFYKITNENQKEEKSPFYRFGYHFHNGVLLYKERCFDRVERTFRMEVRGDLLSLTISVSENKDEVGKTWRFTRSRIKH